MVEWLVEGDGAGGGERVVGTHGDETVGEHVWSDSAHVDDQSVREARSAASRPLLDMIGEEPVARHTLAAKFWTARLVMLW
jgi:hypothetical protein